MKKKIISSALISIVINVIIFLINLICANMFHFLPFSYSLAGGECIEHIGFGIDLIEIFAFTTSGSASNTYQISFNILSIIQIIIGNLMKK